MIRRKQSGFTLMELLVVLAIAAIVASIGYPNLRDAIRKSRIQSETAHLLGDLMFARSEAVKLNRNITICKSDDGADCTEDDDWEQGWLVFRDADDDGEVDSGEEVIRQSGNIAAGIAISGTSDFEDLVIYKPDGRSNASGSSEYFKICSEDDGGSHRYPAKQLNIEPTGRPRVGPLQAGVNCN